MDQDRGAARLVAVRFDADDPQRLAGFWAVALGWEADEPAHGEVALVPTDGTPFTLVFHRATAPKADKNRVHLDLTTTSLEDQAASVATLLGLGASHIDVGQQPTDEHVVLADPEGNELCLIEPDNSFLAGCGRLGSVTCD